MIKTHQRAAWVATLTLALGIVTSLGGNLQAINLGGREPGVGAYISAVFWPLALFAAIEVMLHTPWLASRRDNLTKWVGLASVAGMAAYVSYGHMVHVLLAYGYDKPSGHFGPLAVDGLMAMCTLALNRVGQARRASVPVATPDRDAEAMELADAVANPDEPPAPSAYAPLANRAGTIERRDWVPLDFMASGPAMQRNPGERTADRADVAQDWTGRDVDELAANGILLSAPTEPVKRVKLTDAQRDGARELIRLELARGVAGKTVDVMISESYGVSLRSARRLRSEVTGEPVSGPPSDEPGE